MSTQGIILVLIASISYGLPASLMKQATAEGNAGANLIIFQFTFSFLFIALLSKLLLKNSALSQYKLSKKERIQLILSGSSIALTNTFYFTSLHYVSVAVAAVMLMQSVWIASLFDYLFKKIKPGKIQVVSIVVVLIGTVLATNLLNHEVKLSAIGVVLSFLAGVCYAATILVTNSLSKDAPPLERAFCVSGGALIFVLAIWLWQIDFLSFVSSLKWGIMLAIFSVILPLLCFTKGMPLITAGLGGLLSSLELPAAIVFAYLLLQEQITLLQFLGIVLILLAIMAVNVRGLLRK